MTPPRFDEDGVNCYLDIRQGCFALCRLFEQIRHARSSAEADEDGIGKEMEAQLAPEYEAEVDTLATNLLKYKPLGVPIKFITNATRILPKDVALDVQSAIKEVKKRQPQINQ